MDEWKGKKLNAEERTNGTIFPINQMKSLHIIANARIDNFPNLNLFEPLFAEYTISVGP